ncbi:MAG TPA: hypothetical protein VF796_14125 [Humisphaera sp.]
MADLPHDARTLDYAAPSQPEQDGRGNWSRALALAGVILLLGAIVFLFLLFRSWATPISPPPPSFYR